MIKKHLLIILPFLLMANYVFAQSAITGIIKSSNGTTIPNATVLIRGTKISAIADNDGRFSIDSKQELPFYLRVSSVGYKSQDFQILKLQDAPFELVLIESELLDEIVVTSRRRSEVLQDAYRNYCYRRTSRRKCRSF